MLSESDKDDMGMGGGMDDDSVGSSYEKSKRSKSPKPPKGEKQKKSKGWKTTTDDQGAGEHGEEKSQQPNNGESPSRLSKAQEGELKLNLNPTQIEGQQNEEGKGLQVEIPKGEDDAGNPLASPTSPTQGGGVQPQQLSKRDMDKIILTREARDIKEKLLDFTNEIIVRQNGIDPVANFESFTIETASKRVLKELLTEFQILADDIKKKQTANEDKMRTQRSQIDKIQAIQKKLQTQCQSVENFGKKLEKCENKIEAMRDQNEKRHEMMREHIYKTKDMLEHRVDQVTQFSEKIAIMNEDLGKIKKYNDEFKEKMMTEVFKGQDLATKNTEQLADFKEKAQFFFEKMEFWSEHSTTEVRGLSDSFEALKLRIDTKLTEMNFDIERRVRLDDMRQNFAQLNDLLFVKFKQLEDTKQATRNLITYQKYYQPIETQQLITDNLMTLKMVKGDQNFMIAQKMLYEEATERTKQACIGAQKIEDVDLKEHLEDLQMRELSKNDWDPFPMTDLAENCDFVGELLQRYLDDIRVRKKHAEFGKPPPSALLRKYVRLDEIDKMIETVQAKSIGIAQSAEEMAEELREEQRQRDVKATINRYMTKRIEFQHRAAFKRNKSFKGRNRAPLFVPGPETTEFQDMFDNYNPDDEFARPKSKHVERKDKLRPLKRERNVDYNKPDKKDQGISNMSQTMQSDLQNETNEEDDKSRGEEQVGSQMDMLNSIMDSMKGGVKSGHGEAAKGHGGGGGMTDLQKLQFKSEIIEETKPIIQEIADQRAERLVKQLKDQTLRYQEANEQDKKQSGKAITKELLQVSELLKKQIQSVKEGQVEELRQMNTHRIRDKSDYDIIFKKHWGHIHDNKVSINRHETFFETLAQSVAIIAENINMQMEAEYADLIDRKAMALYGAQPGKATKADFIMKQETKRLQKPHYGQPAKEQKPEASKSPGSDLENVSVDYFNVKDTNKKSNAALTIQESQENIESVEHYLDDNINKIESLPSMQRINSGTNLQNVAGSTTARNAAAGTNTGDDNLDDIRRTSGFPVKRKDMVVTFDQQCLSHQQQGHDTHLTLKMFKMACLAYKPSQITYRDMVIERTAMVEMRRALIDKVSNLLPGCDLFKNNAIYPRRYYDDLMIDERGFVEHMQTIRSKADFKSHMVNKLSNLLNAGNSSTNIGSDVHIKNSSSGLHYSPTQQLNMAKNLTLPELNTNITSKLPFGIGQKHGYDSMSEVQLLGLGAQDALTNRFKSRNQSMTLDIRNNQNIGSGLHQEDDQAAYGGYMAKTSLYKGLNSTKNRAGLNNTDIKRNASVAAVNDVSAPKLFNSSRRNFARLEQLGSTGAHDGIIQGPNIGQNIYNTESKGTINRSPKNSQRSVQKAPPGDTFHRRNNSTIAENFGGLNIEIGGRGLQGLKSHRPSGFAPANQAVKPKVSFDLQTDVKR